MSSPLRLAILTTLALGLIVLGAAILRFADLATNPGGLYLDEAAEALSAHRLLTEPGYHPLFFTDGGGREALFAYLVAGAFRILGESTLTLRATAAALGVATIPAIWLLGRRFGELTGLVAAAWAAGSVWLISISRDGMRNVLVPLLAALALAALLAWADRPSRTRAVAAGLLTAIATLYTYQALRLLPVVVIVWVAWLWRTDSPPRRRIRGTVPALTVAFLVAAIPMLAVAVTDPAAYFGRALGVSIFNAPPGTNLIEHSLRTLGMFAVTGDPNQRHDVAQLPLLLWPLLPVAVVGTGRLWAHRRQPAAALILWSLPVFLLPPLLSVEGGSPHFLRALGLAAPLAVTFGLGASGIVGWLGDRWGRFASAASAGAIAALLVALAIVGGTVYLSRPVAERYQAYRFDLVAMARDAGPADAVILDDYSSNVVRFLDASRLPAILPPGVAMPDAGRYRSILALTPQDLGTALGSAAAQRAVAIERDPAGVPSVWAVLP